MRDLPAPGFNLPYGTSENDPRAPWNAPDAVPCICGHDWEDHSTKGGEPCEAKDCECEQYQADEPDYEPDPDRFRDEPDDRDTW